MVIMMMMIIIIIMMMMMMIHNDNDDDAGGTWNDLHLPPRHVRALRDRDPRQHLLLHARLPDPQVGPSPLIGR